MNNKNTPEMSVIMSFTNKERFVRDAIESILNKTLFSPEIMAYHNFKDNGYNVDMDILAFKNNLIYISKYIPKMLLMIYFLQNLMFYFSRSVRRKWFIKYLQIIRRQEFFIKRKPIPIKHFFKLRSPHLFYYSLLSKIIKR